MSYKEESISKENTLKESQDIQSINQNDKSFRKKVLSHELLDAAKLGAGNFVLAYNVRAGIGVLLRIFQLLKTRPKDMMNLKLLLDEGNLKFRVDAVSLGFFAGWFTGGYKALLCIMRELRGRNEKWHSFVSGSLAGFSVLFVNDKRRRTLALYLLVRALQCAYNAAKAKGLWSFWGNRWKHGDALLFILTSAQVMYGYVMRPETLPPEYNQFIINTGPVTKDALSLVRQNIRGSQVDLGLLTNSLMPSSLGETNPAKSINHPHLDIVPCSIIHASVATCRGAIVYSWIRAFRRTLPLYFSLHLVPSIVFGFQRFMSSPFKMTYRIMTWSFRSTTFLATFCAIYQAAICASRKGLSKDSKYLYYLAGLFSSCAIFIESKSRRSELALYVLPRAADSLFMILQDRRWLAGVAHGEVYLFSFSIGILMLFFEHKKEAMSPFIYKSLRQLLRK